MWKTFALGRRFVHTGVVNSKGHGAHKPLCALPSQSFQPWSAKRKLSVVVGSYIDTDKSLVLYLKRPRAKSWELRSLVGRFRYSDLKEAAPGDYGVCIGMSRS